MGKTINTILNLTDKFTPKLTEAGRQTLIFKQRLINCNSAASKIDSGLAKLAKTSAAVGAAGAAAMGAFAASSLETYKGFQQSMSNVAGILSIDTTSDTYAKLESAAREAGKSTTKTAQESADALSYMALAGWEVEDSMNGLMPILRASEATGADLATTSDLVTDSMSALGLQTNELNHYLDVCARAQNKSNTTLTQMQEAYIACGGTFKNFDTKLDESGALLGILANRGIKGAEAGNSLQSTLVNLTKKSGESYKAMKALGVSAYDSQGKFKGVTTTLKELQEKTAGLTDEQRDTYLTMIGGKNQLTTLNALMAGLSNTLPDGTKEFEALREELKNCEGSLDRMADTMTDNYAGALARAQSAMDDFKITVAQKLEPYLTRFLNWFSSKLPDAAEKFSVWMDSKMPKAINFCKSAFEEIKPVVSFVAKNFSELAIAGTTVVASLKAFSIMAKIQSFTDKLKTSMKGLTTAQKLATVAQTAFNTSLLACPITWIAVTLAAVAGGMLIWKKHMEKADIANHFGDITLSAEECSEIVKNVFGSDIINQADEAASAYDQLQQSLDDVTSSARNLNKLNFQIEMGGDISQEDYLSTVDEYVTNLQDAVKDKQYSLKLNIDLLFDDSEFGNAFSADTNEYYTQLLTRCNTLGTQLREAVENAYEHGWDPDSTEAVASILKNQADIQEKISTAQSEAKLETLKYDFTTGDLSQESFQNLIDATSEELENLKSTYQQARIDAIAQAKLMYGDGSDELANAIQEANDSYNQKMAGLNVKGLQFENEAIMSAYADEFAKIAESTEIVYSEDFVDVFNQVLANNGEIDPVKLSGLVQESIKGVFNESNISDATRKNIGKFFEKMMPTVEEFKKNLQNMETVPEEYASVFTQSNIIGALGKNSTAFKNVAVTTLSTILPSNERKVLEGSKKTCENYISGIATEKNLTEIETATEKLRKKLATVLSKSMTVSVPITATPSVDTGGDTNTPNVDTNAVGTTYFGGGFTRIHENGGEIMDLPTGTRIYPHDVSEKMASNSPSVNVTVNVQGNIFGIDDAADIIGDRVCGRVYDLVNSM